MQVASLWKTLEEQLLPVFAGYRSRLSELPIEIKADRTLLTEADVAVQNLIVREIHRVEPDAVIIAEEDGRTDQRKDVITASGRVWVIDPIDGTAEFVRPERIEFCSVVCLLEDWQPVAAFVLGPELGVGRSPLVIRTDAAAEVLLLNEEPAPKRTSRNGPAWISATRSSDDPVRAFDDVAKQAGYQLKKRTSSQTLDMVRTAVDLTGHTEPALPAFDLFWRRQQKVWDGLAGLCLGANVGLRSVDERGEVLPLGPQLLSQAEPTFDSTVMGRPETVSWFLDATR
ncbi:MAG TPA: inositol monophosphatase family protein [Pseudonocardiaceae bacterium]|jgi:3'(2'), 5'-bisphosphate nucleotidase|nr:inositol monophosphatase family protein [Pseudonocardiaceae bacterium]